MNYKHLNSEQRYTISVLLQRDEPMSRAEIARTIGVHSSTVSRELKRNSDGRGHHKYEHDLAQRKADKRMKDRIGIENRPQIVNEKSRLGDFEIDTMIGKNHKGAIMTTNDRCTQFVLIRRLEGKEATPLAEAAVEALSPYKQILHTRQ